MARTIPVVINLEMAARRAYEGFAVRPPKDFDELSEPSKQKWRRVAQNVLDGIEAVGSND